MNRPGPPDVRSSAEIYQCMLRVLPRRTVGLPFRRTARFLSDMTRPRLTYFGDIGGRGEPIRFVLKLANVDFEDDLFGAKSEEYASRKAKGDFNSNPTKLKGTGGGLPVYVEDGTLYYESNAILRMLGMKHGFYSTDPATAWEIDVCMEKVEQVWKHAGFTPMTLYLVARTTAKVDSLADSDGEATANLVAMYTELAEWGEAQLKKHGKPFLAGTDSPTIADFRYIVQFSDSIFNEGSAIDAKMRDKIKAMMDDKTPDFKKWVEDTMLPLLKDVRTPGILW